MENVLLKVAIFMASFLVASASPSPFSPTAPILGSILRSLGFRELSVAAYSLTESPWSGGPYTIFAPTDAALSVCGSCSVSRILQEHTLPGIFSVNYLRTLAFGTKLETMVPGRCITITSDLLNGTKVFLGGAEIDRPNLFNNGFVVVHGLSGFVSHLSPFSCILGPAHPVPAFSVMRLMLRDASMRLRISGYSVLALALRVKYAELAGLQNVTVFGVDDAAIFAGGQAYVRDVRFHIVPNRLLMASDLEEMPAATVLPTLERNQTLVVTTAGGGGVLEPMRINHVRITSPNVVHNLKIVVHGLSKPFPHLNDPPVAQASSCEIEGSMDGYESCALAPTLEIKSTAEIDDDHGF